MKNSQKTDPLSHAAKVALYIIVILIAAPLAPIAFQVVILAGSGISGMVR